MDINLISNKEEKIELAKKIAAKIKGGETIGFGSRIYIIFNSARNSQKSKR